MRTILRRTLLASVAALLMFGAAQLMRAQNQRQSTLPTPSVSAQPAPSTTEQAIAQILAVNRIRIESGVADADWDALKPKVQAVMEKRLPMLGSFGDGLREGGIQTARSEQVGARPAYGNVRGSRVARPAYGNARRPRTASPAYGNVRSTGMTGGTNVMRGPQMEELTALREAVKATGASDTDIKAKLDAFVVAYKKRQQELKTAQDALAAAVGGKVKLKAILILDGLLPVS